MNNLTILYEDNHVIVVVKPINVPSQKDSSNDEDMTSIIKKYLKEKYNKKGNVYLGLVHRLDRPVSGVMVFAKTSKAASRLSESIKTKNSQKEYLAIVHGKTSKEGKLINKISKNEKTHFSFIDEENGKEGVLYYKTLKYDEEKDLSLLKINLITGRHHQIRLQLSNINHPIYGDQRYGRQDKKQIALFAYKLEFIHPTKKEKMSFKAFPLEDGVWNLLEDVKEKL